MSPSAPSIFTDLAADDTAVVVAVVALRLFVPLLIPRFPLPMIVVALLLDAADHSLLERFSEIDLGPDGPYQSFDKALDIHYLAIAYLATLRNWTSDAAFRISQFLFYYRLVGVLLFELLDSRALLLVFPNTFEYFFIAYELVRLRFEPSRFSARLWLATAVVIWVVVKLPQEYWIHVAQGDFTDAAADHPAVGAACVLVVAGLLAVVQFVVRPRLPAPDWGWRLAAGPLPLPLGRARVRHAAELRRGPILWVEVGEKAVLLGLLGVVFAEILPDVDATPVQVMIGAGVVVVANTAISTWAARSGRAGIESAVLRFAALIGVNLVFVYVVDKVLVADQAFQLGDGLFFAFIVTLIVWLFDEYKPEYHARFDGSPLRVTSPRDLWRRVRLGLP